MRVRAKRLYDQERMLIDAEKEDSHNNVVAGGLENSQDQMQTRGKYDFRR